jgi:hypothetical protein
LGIFNGSPHNALNKLEYERRSEDPADASQMKNATSSAQKALKDGFPDPQR